MTTRPAEATKFHTRLQKCTLEVENSRAYWSRVQLGHKPAATQAHEGYWFGAKSLARADTLLQDFSHRYDSIPQALNVLSHCRDVDADTRRLICHWHLQFADPLYRKFTGDFLPSRIAEGRPEISKDLVVSWIESVNPGQWQVRTQMKFATNLFRASREAGLTESTRDPRTAKTCVTTDVAICYLVYLLREIAFDGSLVENPYLKSVGLEGSRLEQRFKSLSAIEFRKQGSLVDFGWRYESLLKWAEANLFDEAVSEAS